MVSSVSPPLGILIALGGRGGVFVPLGQSRHLAVGRQHVHPLPAGQPKMVLVEPAHWQGRAKLVLAAASLVPTPALAGVNTVAGLPGALVARLALAPVGVVGGMEEADGVLVT